MKSVDSIPVLDRVDSVLGPNFRDGIIRFAYPAFDGLMHICRQADGKACSASAISHNVHNVLAKIILSSFGHLRIFPTSARYTFGA